jgi:hypothetical protein
MPGQPDETRGFRQITALTGATYDIDGAEQFVSA